MPMVRCLLCHQLVDPKDCYWSATYNPIRGQPDSLVPTCTDCLLDVLVLAFGESDESEAHPNEDAPLASDFEE